MYVLEIYSSPSFGLVYEPVFWLSRVAFFRIKFKTSQSINFLKQKVHQHSVYLLEFWKTQFALELFVLPMTLPYDY